MIVITLVFVVFLWIALKNLSCASAKEEKYVPVQTKTTGGFNYNLSGGNNAKSIKPITTNKLSGGHIF